MERILVSACLLGVNCKYNGGNNYNDKINEYLKDKSIILVCPEIMGGLGIPRIPVEIKNGKAINKDGLDVTKYFVRGAEEVLELVKKYNIKQAILKSKVLHVVIIRYMMELFLVN